MLSMETVRVVVGLLLVVVALAGVVHAEEVPRARPHIRVFATNLNIDEELRLREDSRLRASSTEKVLNPTELKALYGSSSSATAGAGKTIALIDAFGASTAEADLGVFSTKFGLPACTTANGCFKKVDQNGGTNYPADDNGWGSETALDVQTAHAVAPGAKILLVVAASDGFNDLFAAVNYAKAHADYVSMSFGGGEGSYVTSYDTTYFGSTPKVSFFASTGDDGSAGGVEFPSTSPHVIAVGGTSLYTTSTYTLGSEQGWNGGGGGCSAYFTAPTTQSADSGYSAVGCGGKRAVPDLAFDADPNSGVYVYYSYQCNSAPNCYQQVGGTSLASPIAAARAATKGVVVNSAYVYSTTPTYRDITIGSNGAYSCRTGFDLVTGKGAWIN